MTCYKPGARSRFFYRIRIRTGRKGERRSLSEADYAGLITAAPSRGRRRRRSSISSCSRNRVGCSSPGGTSDLVFCLISG